MTDDSPGESPDRNQSSTAGPSPPQLDPHQDGVSLAEVTEVQEGEAIAVRAVQQTGQTILAGTVTSIADETETPAAIEQSLHDKTFTTIFSIEPGTWWDLSEAETTDRSQRLQDRPQAREYVDLPPKDAPPCSLAYWETGDVALVIPMPVSNGSRVLYYTTDVSGTVVELTTGPLVLPDRLFPDRYEPPDR